MAIPGFSQFLGVAGYLEKKTKNRENLVPSDTKNNFIKKRGIHFVFVVIHKKQKKGRDWVIFLKRHNDPHKKAVLFYIGIFPHSPLFYFTLPKKEGGTHKKLEIFVDEREWPRAHEKGT